MNDIEAYEERIILALEGIQDALTKIYGELYFLRGDRHLEVD